MDGNGQLALENAGMRPMSPQLSMSGFGASALLITLSQPMVGELDKAYEEIDKTLVAGGGLTHRAYVTLMVLETLAGNLAGAKQAALRLLNHCGVSLAH